MNTLTAFEIEKMNHGKEHSMTELMTRIHKAIKEAEAQGDSMLMVFDWDGASGHLTIDVDGEDAGDPLIEQAYSTVIKESIEEVKAVEFVQL